MRPKINNYFREAPFIEDIMTVSLPLYVKIPTIRYDRSTISDNPFENPFQIEIAQLRKLIHV